MKKRYIATFLAGIFALKVAMEPDLSDNNTPQNKPIEPQKPIHVEHEKNAPNSYQPKQTKRRSFIRFKPYKITIQGHTNKKAPDLNAMFDNEIKAVLAYFNTQTLPSDTLELVNEVNKRVNEIPYNDDDIVWGKRDYWAMPSEFIKKEAGDCEDYVFTKFFLLREQGVPEDHLYINYLPFMQGFEGAHMVLSVYTQEEGWLILDNLYDEPLKYEEHVAIGGYKTPAYSFNTKTLTIGNRLFKAEETELAILDHEL